MSDRNMGEGWWEASDGKWYPPHKKAGLPPPPPDSSRDAEDSGLEAMAATKSSGLEDMLRNRVLVFAFIALLVVGLTVLALTQTGKGEGTETESTAQAESDLGSTSSQPPLPGRSTTTTLESVAYQQCLAEKGYAYDPGYDLAGSADEANARMSCSMLESVNTFFDKQSFALYCEELKAVTDARMANGGRTQWSEMAALQQCATGVRDVNSVPGYTYFIENGELRYPN